MNKAMAAWELSIGRYSDCAPLPRPPLLDPPLGRVSLRQYELVYSILARKCEFLVGLYLLVLSYRNLRRYFMSECGRPNPNYFVSCAVLVLSISTC